MNYSFTGASIAEDVKTVSVKTFQSYAPLANANLSQTFTEELKDKFLSQTNLDLTNIITPVTNNLERTVYLNGSYIIPLGK